MNPNIPQITTGNPLASRWQNDSSNPEETPAGYRDQWFEYNMDFLVPANTLAQNLFIILDRDADFVFRQLEPTAYQVGANTPYTLVGAFRFKDSFGNPLDDDLVTQEVHGPFFPQLILPAGSRFFLDFDNTQNAFQTQVAVILRGCKRFKRPGGSR
jgi:hypothetical protein